MSYNILFENHGSMTKQLTFDEVPKQHQEVMECLKDFVKYNISLIHLDLQNTGLIRPFILYIAHFLTRAQSLRCIHLCGNPGLTEIGQDGVDPELL